MKLSHLAILFVCLAVLNGAYLGIVELCVRRVGGPPEVCWVIRCCAAAMVLMSLGMSAIILVLCRKRRTSVSWGKGRYS